MENTPKQYTAEQKNEFDLKKFSQEDRQKIMELRAIKEGWEHGGEKGEEANVKAQAWAADFLVSHPDARDYALFQVLIGGHADGDAITGVDYPDGAIYAAAQELEKPVRDSATGRAEAA